MDYVERVLSELKQKNPNEPEFHQAATEILNGLRPVVEKHPEYEIVYDSKDKIYRLVDANL